MTREEYEKFKQTGVKPKEKEGILDPVIRYWKKSSLLKKIGLVWLALIPIGAVQSMVPRAKPEPRPSSWECSTAVQARLKAPSTAKIQRPQLVYQTESQAAYHVTFDAQNGFGAMLRGTATCEYVRTKDSYALVRVDFIK